MMQIQYENIYKSYYGAFFNALQKKIKLYFVQKKQEELNFNYSYNTLQSYFIESFPNVKNKFRNFKKLESLLQIFHKKGELYENNIIRNILNREIKIEFDKLKLEDKPLNYSFEKLIIDFAKLESTKEISRLLSHNYRLFEYMYELNDFSKFEIKKYNLNIEQTELYKELSNRLFPINEEEISFFEDFKFNDNESINKYSLPFIIAFLNEIGFFELKIFNSIQMKSKAKIVAVILNKDEKNNNVLRTIEGNLRTLDKYSKENRERYTSEKSIEKAKEKLKEII